MHLLQAVENVSDWTGSVIGIYTLVIVVYGIGLFILYWIIRAAITAGTAHLRKQSKIANHLHAEELRMKGASDERIREILNT